MRVIYLFQNRADFVDSGIAYQQMAPSIIDLARAGWTVCRPPE
jgi:hypothetical protein